jgi:hypothetical protein
MGNNVVYLRDLWELLGGLSSLNFHFGCYLKGLVERHDLMKRSRRVLVFL